MIAEESETPKGEPPHPSERDLLAERRARRAAESPDAALVRRAEAAEATVKTLETHLASLQQRLLETEESGRRSAERLAERELQLRRVKQQEYAEQQLRIEAEQALHDANRRHAGSDGQAKVLGELQERVAELERRSTQLARELDAERIARERTERTLDAMRESHTAMAATVGELRAVAASLRAAAEWEPPPASPPPLPAHPLMPAHPPMPAHPLTPGHPRTPTPPRTPESPQTPAPEPGASLSSQARREEIADALAVAVERLRARAEAQARDVSSAGGEPPPPAHSELAPAPAHSPDAQSQQRPGAPKAKPHKHSMSLIGRWRAARKQRREGR